MYSIFAVKQHHYKRNALQTVWHLAESSALQYSLPEPEAHHCQAMLGLHCKETGNTGPRSYRLSEPPLACKTEQNTQQEAQVLFDCFLFT